jgi:hypothetical protein
MPDFDDFSPANAAARQHGAQHFHRHGIAISVLALVFVLTSGDEETAEEATPRQPPRGSAADARADPGTETPEATPEPTPTPERLSPPAATCMRGVRVAGTLARSLKSALPRTKSSLATILGERLESALQWKIDPRRDLRAGDEAKIVSIRRRAANACRLYGFWYQSRKTGKEYFYIYFPDKTAGDASFFDEQGQGISGRNRTAAFAGGRTDVGEHPPPGGKNGRVLQRTARYDGDCAVSPPASPG